MAGRVVHRRDRDVPGVVGLQEELVQLKLLLLKLAPPPERLAPELFPLQRAPARLRDLQYPSWVLFLLAFPRVAASFHGVVNGCAMPGVTVATRDARS